MTAAAFHSVERPVQHHVSLLAFARPFVLLAVLAFLAGFGGYLILGPPNALDLIGAPPPTAATTSPATPASAGADDWNAPKQI